MTFLREQCKGIEENNRMGKTRDFFKKIRNTKGALHAKRGTIKDIDIKDLIEAEAVKKMWQEYTELYWKGLNGPESHDGVITHLEPGHPGVWSIMGHRKHYYEQSWWRWWHASWTISGPAIWCCESAVLSMPANLENSAVAIGLGKGSFHSNPREGQLHSFHMVT